MELSCGEIEIDGVVKCGLKILRFIEQEDWGED